MDYAVSYQLIITKESLFQWARVKDAEDFIYLHFILIKAATHQGVHVINKQREKTPSNNKNKP